MNKESADSLELKIGQRKKLLFNKDLEQMQKDFLEKKEKCNSKIIKLTQENKNIQIKNKNPEITLSSNVKKVKGKKKIKDIITLNIPLSNTISNPKSNLNEPKSLFSLNFDNNPKLNEVDINTGLPQTFKIKENKSEIENNKEIKENKENNKIETEKNQKDNTKNYHKCKEYEKINEENNERISQMSKEEILAAQKEILSMLPTDLIEKIKKGGLKEQMQKCLENPELENKNDSNFDEISENNNEEINENLNINEITKSNDDENSKKKNQENKESKEVILYSYDGKIKKILSQNQDNEKENMIDYRNLTFNELELNNKYFSLNEINFLLSSSNHLQVSIGLKIIYNILQNNYHFKIEQLIDELDSLTSKLSYLINSNNFNIKNFSLKCLLKIYQDFLYEDYKQFKFLSMLVGCFPSIIINNYEYQNKNIQKQKKLCIKNIIDIHSNQVNDYVNTIRNCENEEINNSYISLLFYITYAMEKIPCKISFLFDNIETTFWIKNQRFLKILLIFGNLDEILENLQNFDKFTKNKIFLKYILELRGIKNNIIANNNLIFDKITTKKKIYTLNYFLLFNNNKNLLNELKFDLYSKEKDYLLLSKILQYKLYYSLNINNNQDNDEYLSIINSDNELQSLTDIFNSSISLILNDNTKNYYELISAYKYISTFLYFWHKTFKYPKLISFKKINIDLNDLIKLFTIFTSELNKIINEKFSFKNIFIYDKNDLIRIIYKYTCFLELGINYVNCFIKDYDSKTNINGLSLFIINLSQLINKSDEYFYHKYIKILKTLLMKKIEINKENQKYFEYKSIEEDLNFYLYSNEDLRQSTFYKKIFKLSETNNERLKNIIYKENIFSSKYFPFDNNFILQVISNDKAKVSIKINYLLIFMILYENENIDSVQNINTPFELMIKFLVNFADLNEFSTNLKIKEIFNLYVRKYLLGNISQNVNMIKNDSNKLILNNFFKKYKNNLNINENNRVLIEVIPLLVLFLHNNMNDNSHYLEAIKFKETIEEIIYENMSSILEYENFFDLNYDEDSKIIDWITMNLSVSLTSLYQSMILSFFKWKKFINKDSKCSTKKNMIYLFIEKLIEIFGINTEKYLSSFKESNSNLQDLIQNYFIKK